MEKRGRCFFEGGGGGAVDTSMQTLGSMERYFVQFFVESFWM